MNAQNRRNRPESTPNQTVQPRKKDHQPEMTSDESREFTEDEVVWAKVVGHPWWPGVVAQKSYPSYHFDEGAACLRRKEVTYKVNFFGEASHAFLEQSKLAEYLPNRDYFIEMALKNSKRCNIEAFRASVQQADIISQSIDQVEEVPLVSTPKKERQGEGEQTGKGKHAEDAAQNQKSALEKQNNKNDLQKKSDLPHLEASEGVRKISRFLLKQLKVKNNNQYTTATLKKAVIRAIKAEKSLKKVDNAQSQQTVAWVQNVLAMSLDQFVHHYCRRSEISRKAIVNNTREEKRKPVHVQLPSKSQTYMYIDQLGTQRISSEPLRPIDFQIRL